MPSELTFKDINLGSVEMDQFVDSSGVPLIEAGPSGATSSYTFELGAFVSEFVPSDINYEDWATNWRTFDVAQYVADPDIIGFQGGMTVDGKTVSDHQLAESEFNFSDLDAYIWIYNDTTPEPGSQWFVGRADSWSFPDISLFQSGCDGCPGELPVNWSTSELVSDAVGEGVSNDVPLFGSQNGIVGEGSFTQINNDYTLQTFAFVPEPSTLFLPLIISAFVLLKRIRRPFV